MENENELYDLIEEYDFSELDEKQKEFVLLTMTARKYADLRKTILSASAYFDNEPIIMEDLSVPIIKKKNVLVKMISYKLPIYKVAAILVIVFSISKLIPEQNNKETQLTGMNTELINYSERFNSYSSYSSNNSIKYNRGLSSVCN